MSGRGQYTIFLGMVAGVGKTYRMLQEGHAAKAAGRDVVVGLVETHGRAETAALTEGLALQPRREVDHRGTILTEMDLPGLLHRHPDVALVDELAHTNAPGVEHEKRYQDIKDLLDAGIDVISTVNVQHLESLNDRVTELSGVRIRETVPDAVLKQADEVVLVDVPPDALLGRLRAGKVYSADRIDAALNGFFKVENLSALREFALRQVAEEVEAKRVAPELLGTRGDDDTAAAAAQAVGERLMALVEPHPSSQRLVRRAWRSAQRLGADLDLLWVAAPGREPDEEQQRQLRALTELASILGATLLREESDDVAAAIALVARTRGTTYILMGRARPARGLGRLRTPLLQRLIYLLPGVDVRIVADRAVRRPGAEA